MPLQMLQVTDLPVLDYVGYLLGFEGIEVGFGQDGLWRIFYEGPCGFLSPEDGTCTVYRTSRQPNVCVAYDPYRCWYRESLAGGGTSEYRSARKRFWGEGNRPGGFAAGRLLPRGC